MILVDYQFLIFVPSTISFEWWRFRFQSIPTQKLIIMYQTSVPKMHTLLIWNWKFEFICVQERIPDERILFILHFLIPSSHISITLMDIVDILPYIRPILIEYIQERKVFKNQVGRQQHQLIQNISVCMIDIQALLLLTKKDYSQASTLNRNYKLVQYPSVQLTLICELEISH